MITAGSRVGPYEVRSAIGAGGTGEVYRARDSNLNRDVALKVLPEAFQADVERLARFEREARVLASLKADPDWRRLPAGTPEPIRRLLRRCLQKDRKLRLHDMADVQLELEDASNAPQPGMPIAPTVLPGRERLAWVSAVTTPAPLFATRILGGLPGQGNHKPQYMVSPDGRFLIHTVVEEDTWPIIVILNWKPGA